MKDEEDDSLLSMFALGAMMGILSARAENGYPTNLARDSYDIANMMMEERRKRLTGESK